MKRSTSRALRRIALVLALLLAPIGVAVYQWLIPTLIVKAIREKYDGHVAISGWWIDGSSAGVTGLALHEGPDPRSPAWAAVDRVATDLSIYSLFRGRFMPDRVELDRPSISYRIGADGKPLTQIPLKSSGEGEVPEVALRDGTLAMRQADRQEMVVHHLDGSLEPQPDGPVYKAKADDPAWGHPAVEGRLTPDFSAYSLRLTADRIPSDMEKVRSIPFVAESIWDYVQPKGPVGVVLELASKFDGSSPLDMVTTVTFQGTTVDLPTLGLHGEDANGPLTVRDLVVTMKGVTGRMCGGRVAFRGPMNFQHEPYRYDLDLDLDGVDLTELPESWQLHRLGVRGRFTGNGGLRLALKPGGLDMTGTSGSGVVDGAEIRGIPLKRLDLSLHGEGLRTDQTDEHPETEGPFLPQWVRGTFRVKDVDLDRTIATLEAPGQPGGKRFVPVTGRLDLAAEVRFPLGALEDWRQYTVQGTADIAAAQIGGLDLGRLRGRLGMIEGILEVADIRGRVLRRPEGGGRPPSTEPPPAEGPLPPGGFRGRVHAAVVGDRDLRVELEGAELPIDELAAAAPTLSKHPVSQSPPERLPVSGRLTFSGSGRSRGADPTDPASWTASGKLRMPEVAFQSTTARDVTADIEVKDGRALFPEINGRLGDASFRGRLELGMDAPYSYHAVLETDDLTCREVVALASGSSDSSDSSDCQSHRGRAGGVSPLSSKGESGGRQPPVREPRSQGADAPRSPRNPPPGTDPASSPSTKVEGTIAGRGEAEGTLSPWRLARSEGWARVVGLEYGRLHVGDVPIRWTTEADTVVVQAEEHQRYGGRVSAEARVPVQTDRPIEGTFKLTQVDAAELSSHADQDGKGKLTGRADGNGWFRYERGPRPLGDKDLPLEAEARLEAHHMKLGEIPTHAVQLKLTMRDGNPRFEAGAEGLGGTIHLTGGGHLSKDASRDEIEARLQALGVELYELWGAMGTSGALANLRGRVSIEGRGRAVGGLDLAHAHLEGNVEVDDPIWGFDYRLANKTSAAVSKDPDGWRIGPLGGELFGGKLLGDGIWMYRDGRGRERYGADIRVHQLMLPRALAFIPEANRRLGGTASLQISGRADRANGGTIEIRAERGQVNGLHLSALRIPGEWTLPSEGSGVGSVHLRRAEGQLAGGRIGGEAHFALGSRRDFRARMFVDDVDLRVISREQMGIRPVPGRLTGYVHVYGMDPANPMSYRGELEFDLEQASLVDIPLLDELDRSLGSTGGGVFDDGDVHGTIVERKVNIDRLTLVGPLAQVHATGTVDFDGRLDLEVVVNNTKGVYQSGQAIMSRSPNVADEVARRAAQIDQVRDFVSSRLMKFRITGTIQHPIANMDRSIDPGAALGFFLKTMRLSAQSR